MENASKALIMAGSILIAIIVISFGIIIFRNMSTVVRQEANLDKQQIMAFNSRITPFLGDSVSGSQVNTLMQLIRTINVKARNENDNVREMTVNGSQEVTRFETGRFYKVEGKYNSMGLLTIITVTGPLGGEGN